MILAQKTSNIKSFDKNLTEFLTKCQSKIFDTHILCYLYYIPLSN